MISVKYSIKDLEAKTALKGLTERLSNSQQALKECGLVLLRSISKNFKQGGRPAKWKKSNRGGKTLIDTARLKNSITMRLSGNTVVVGTNVKYARIHQLGGSISKNVAVKKHWRYITKAFGKPISGRRVLVKSHDRKMNTNIPARPYLVAQDSDIRIFERIFEDYLTG